MRTTEEMIKVMQAFNEGKLVEYRMLGDDEWNAASGPVWDWYNYDYRIKPEAKVRPFQTLEEVMGAIKAHGPFIRSRTKYEEPSKAVHIIERVVTRNDGVISFQFNGYDDMMTSSEADEELHGIAWADGTPFGIEEE